MIRLLFAGLVFIFSNALLANQVFEVKDGDRVSVTLSSQDLTRIMIEGVGKITDVRGSAGHLSIEPDKKKGEIYVKPISQKLKSSFFISDSFGNTYTIVAAQADVPAQTVIFKPKGIQRGASQYQRRFKSYALKKQVGELGKAMSRDVEVDGFELLREKEPVIINLWKEVEFALIRTYSGDDLKGQVFVLTNVTNDTLKLHEKEFLHVGRSKVIASSIAKHSLKPGESTFVFLVKEAG